MNQHVEPFDVDETTPVLGLTKPAVGASDDTWGVKLNTNFDILDNVGAVNNAQAAQIATNAANIAANAAEIAVERDRNDDQDALIAGNTASQDARDDAQDALIASNTTAQDDRDDAQDVLIANNAANITTEHNTNVTQAGQISTNAGNIAANTANIATNTANILIEKNRNDAQDILIAAKIGDAPSDSQLYGRKDNAWSAINEASMGIGEWTFSSTTTTPPSSGQIRLDNASQALATHIYISNITALTKDVTKLLLLALKKHSKILLQNKDNSAQFCSYDVTADAVAGAGGTYADVAVVMVENGSALPNGQRCLMIAISAGAGGGAVYIQDAAPVGVDAGSLWWESDTGILYVNYDDGTSIQWVSVVGASDPTTYAVRYDIAQTLTSDQKSQARANIDALKKNYIINGAMMVSQENGLTASTANLYYAVDQFYSNYSYAGVVSLAQIASATPAGSPNRLRATVTTPDASVAAGDFYCITTRIEGIRTAGLLFGTASAKAITLRFGCKGPAGTYCVGINNSLFNRSIVGEFTISAGEANTDVVKSVTLAGDQTGTWAIDSTVGWYVFFALMAGANFQTPANAWVSSNKFSTSNQSNFLGTNGNVFELFDLALVEGSLAPEFQVPDFASELALCKRYWQKSYEYATAPGTATGVGCVDNYVGTAMATALFAMFSFPVEMRTIPAPTVYDLAGTSGKVYKFANGKTAVVQLVSSKSSQIGTNDLTSAVEVAFQWTMNARL